MRIVDLPCRLSRHRLLARNNPEHTRVSDEKNEKIILWLQDLQKREQI